MYIAPLIRFAFLAIVTFASFASHNPIHTPIALDYTPTSLSTGTDGCHGTATAPTTLLPSSISGEPTSLEVANLLDDARGVIQDAASYPFHTDQEFLLYASAEDALFRAHVAVAIYPDIAPDDEVFAHLIDVVFEVDIAAAVSSQIVSSGPTAEDTATSPTSIATMPTPTCPITSLTIDVIRSFFDEEKLRLGETVFKSNYANSKNPSKNYGPQGTNGKRLIKSITSSKKVQTAYKKAKKSKVKSVPKLEKLVKDWLLTNNRFTQAKSRALDGVKVRANGDAIAPGELTMVFRLSGAGTAAIAADEGKGLCAVFENFDEGMDAIKAVLAYELSSRGDDVDAIHNVFASFDDGRPFQIALKQAEYVLKVLAEESGQSVNDILGGLTLKQIHKMKVKTLEKKVRAHVKVEAREKSLNGDAERHIGTLRFLTLSKVKVLIADIKRSLENCVTAAIPCKDPEMNGPYFFPAAIKELIIKHFCVGGGTVQRGLHPSKYEREWLTMAGRYVINLYGRNGEIVDTMAEKNDSDAHDDIHFKVPFPGEKNRYVRVLKLTEETKNGLTTHSVVMGLPDGTTSSRRHHQILQQVQHSHGLGPQNNDELNEHLGGLSFEEKYPYNPKFENDYARRISRWKRRFGKIDVEFASLCDVDHCVGRSKIWMNHILFTDLCSHRWNSCMSKVRIVAGDWCYGLGTKVYGSGND